MIELDPTKEQLFQKQRLITNLGVSDSAADKN